MRFLGLAKIHMNQIRSTEVISNQKGMSERIPSLMLWKLWSAGYLDYFLKIRTSENRTTEIRRSQGLSVRHFDSRKFCPKML